MREHVVSWVMGNPPASAWRTGGEPGPTPQVVLLAVFSHPLSRSFPLLDRPPVLCLWWADRMSSTPRTNLVLSLHRQTRHGKDKRRQDSTAHHPPGKNCMDNPLHDRPVRATS